MACGAQQKSLFQSLFRRMLRADWIVGAEPAKFDGIPQVLVDLSANLHQPAKCSFGIG